jgi:hypothetical protein
VGRQRPRLLLNPSAREFTVTAPIRAAIALEKGGVTTQDAEERVQFDLLRDIFGNPFRTVSFDPAWRTSAVGSLARSIYESRDFSIMPILADALQEAGCENEGILSHCRSAGPHVRGCWVVDLALREK